MFLYEPTEENDLLLITWWEAMVSAGDMEQTFARTMWPLSAFLQSFQEPHSLMLELDQEGVWFAAWLDPAFDGAFFGAWIRKDMRATKKALAAIEQAYHVSFATYPVLVGVTKQPKLLDLHRRLGYTVLGKVPHFWGKSDVWVCVLTQEAFEAAKEKRHGKESKQSSGSSASRIKQRDSGSGAWDQASTRWAV